LNAAFLQLESAEDGSAGELLVGPGFAAITALLDNGDATREACKSSKRERRLERGIVQTHSMECEFIIRRMGRSNGLRVNIGNSLFRG